MDDNGTTPWEWLADGIRLNVTPKARTSPKIAISTHFGICDFLPAPLRSVRGV